MSSLQTPGSSAHLLLIDDNIDELRLLVSALRDAGHRLSIAFDPVQGLRRAAALQPDLILLDVQMNSMDGYALCRLLKADAATADIPVIFVTAAASLDERLTGLRGGAVDYVTKPFDPPEVLARVAIHLALASGREASQTPSADTPTESAADPVQRADQVLVQAAIDLLMSDLTDPASLATIAARLGTHEKRLSRVFREQRGETVFGFLREARLAKARRLLAQTLLGMEDIAAETGFSNGANLATAFRQRFGATPSAFRRSGAAAADPLSEARQQP
ncbi:response regulator [Variovorax sp. GB1P17]|uniref:response regulator n=1 Tax=Variovorax sp. GB1P17 TaxID=3443740 RepID=UPI003F482EEA